MQVLVYDGAQEALRRRVDALREIADPSQVVATSSRAAFLLLAEAAPADSLALVDLLATDRLALDRPGERLIRRLVRNPRTAHVRVFAWSAHPAEDIVASVRVSGATGFVTASLDPAAERTELVDAMRGRPVWPRPESPTGGTAPDPLPAPWADWFERRFDLPWEPWIEPVLVRLVADDRTAGVQQLIEQGVARSKSHAGARLRTVSRALAGEHSNTPATVARHASNVLAYIAGHRPLDEQPAVLVSLERGAHAIRTSPSIVHAAGLSADEVEEIVEIDRLIQHKRAAEEVSPGAPPSDKVLLERRWAAGQRAVTLGADRADVDQVIEGVLARLDHALVALDDARQDELYHPEALAAAALALVRPIDAERLDEVTVDGGVVRFRGRSVLELAVDQSIPVKDLRALIAAVDEFVLATLRP